MANLILDVEALCRMHGATPEALEGMDPDLLLKFFHFRLGCLKEELTELTHAASADEAVDAIIDLTVFALGTLVAFGVDAREAWVRVHQANMNKVRGVKPGRPNPFGFPDMVKPEGWVAPSHTDNVGLLGRVFDGQT